MPQLQLPIFPAGTTPITAELGFECQGGKVTYLNGHLPVFQHAQEDLAAFRLFTSQLVVNGTVSQADRREVIERIAGKLRQFTDPKTGERVVQAVYLPETAYQGTNVSFAPDLVVGFSDLQAELARDLIRRGVPVLVTNQRSVAEILQTIRLVAAAVGRAEAGERLATGLAEGVARVAAQAAALPRRPRRSRSRERAARAAHAARDPAAAARAVPPRRRA